MKSKKTEKRSLCVGLKLDFHSYICHNETNTHIMLTGVIDTF